MKKIILAMVFVFTSGTMMNANSSKKSSDFKKQSCLMNAYDWANALEADSQTGSWSNETWVRVMNHYFRLCRNLKN
jgi:hypothetical protein